MLFRTFKFNIKSESYNQKSVTMIPKADPIDIQLQSAGSLYRQENPFHNLTDTRAEDLKSSIKIGQVNEHLRALPPQTSGFYKYFFLCLLNIFRQWHVIYFMVFVFGKGFFLCSLQLEAFISELFLIVTYLILQIYLRYKTYLSYILTEQRLRENNFQTWSKQNSFWVKTSYSDLKPGQIVKIKSTLENNNVLNPVNLLPMYLPSKKSHFQLKTTKINKLEQTKQIPLFQVFKKIVTTDQLSRDTLEQLAKIRISFEYTIQDSNVFEGRLKVDENQVYFISNRLILPQGVPVLNEDFIIGVVLIDSSNLNEKSLKRALNAENQTMVKVGKTLIPMAIFFIAIGIIIYLIEFLLMYLTNLFLQNHRPQQQIIPHISLKDLLMFGIGNLLSPKVQQYDNQSYFVYVGMFIFLLIHRLRDSHVLNTKSEMLIKNHIKSIDQFGQTNTIIMDDYFFIDKNLFQVEDMLSNSHTEFKFDQELIYSIIEKSQLLKEEMYDLWMSTLRHFRTMPRRYTKIEKEFNLHIKKEKVFKESLKHSTVILVVEVNVRADSKEKSLQAEKYIFRFGEKPRYTSIERLKDENLKLKARLLIKNKDLLHIMVEVMRVESSLLQQDSEAYQLISRNYEPNRYEFLALISHKINSNPYTFPLSLIKNQEIAQKQNLIILSNKKWKYIELVLQKNHINIGLTLTLEEKEFQNIRYDIEFHIRQLKEINSINEKNAILAVHCNLVTYLTSPQIINGLLRLARYCKYIIFYGCSQYEKEICCMNLFEIFPLHIYLSNYLCDLQLIQKSNLSVCQKGESTQPYVTLVVKTYKDLQYLILNEAVESINITVFIIKSFLFKNTILIISIIIAEFMVYQGEYFQPGVEYTGVLFLTYNLFTCLPVVFYIFFRPQVWEQPIYKNNEPNKLFKLQYLTDRKVVSQFYRAVFIGAFITVINFSFLQSTVIENLFFSILSSCVVASVYYQLFIDDALEKRAQVIISIVTYVLFYMFIYFLQLWNDTEFRLVLIETNLTTGDTVYFFLSNVLILPCILGFIFYGMSVSNAKIQPQMENTSEASSQASSMYEIPAKTNQEYGKELHFRQF